MHLDDNGALVITTCLEETLDRLTLPVDPHIEALGHIRQLCIRQAQLCPCLHEDYLCAVCTLATEVYQQVPESLKISKSGVHD